MIRFLAGPAPLRQLTHNLALKFYKIRNIFFTARELAAGSVHDGALLTSTHAGEAWPQPTAVEMQQLGGTIHSFGFLPRRKLALLHRR